MTNITEHFTWEELNPHGYTLTEGDKDCLVNLAANLELLREIVKHPIRVTSGFRSLELNEMIGGSKNSQHLYGRAADIIVVGIKAAELFIAAHCVDAFRRGGIGLYPEANFVHVDMRLIQARWLGKGKTDPYQYVYSYMLNGRQKGWS